MNGGGIVVFSFLYKSIYIFECFKYGSLMLIDKGNFLGGFNFDKSLEIFMIWYFLIFLNEFDFDFLVWLCKGWLSFCGFIVCGFYIFDVLLNVKNFKDSNFLIGMRNYFF